MLRRFLCLGVLLVLLMAVSGCLVTQSTYVKKEEEANTLTKTVADLDQRNKEITARDAKLQAENDELKKEAAAKDELLRKKSEDIARQDAKQTDMVNEMDRMKAQVAKSRETAVEDSPAARKSAGLKSIRIKVLSGDGKIDSAKRMSKRLTGMGYRVEAVAMADNSDYPANTVYFAEKYKKEAKTLATKLGRETIMKPLTWKSVFNVIVATGG